MDKFATVKMLDMEDEPVTGRQLRDWILQDMQTELVDALDYSTNPGTFDVEEVNEHFILITRPVANKTVLVYITQYKVMAGDVMTLLEKAAYIGADEMALCAPDFDTDVQASKLISWLQKTIEYGIRLIELKGFRICGSPSIGILLQKYRGE